MAGFAIRRAGVERSTSIGDVSRRAYVVLLALAVLDSAGYSIIGPTLPSISRATGAGPAVAGALVASFPLGLLIGFALGGRGIHAGRSTAVMASGLAVVGVGALAFVLGDGLAVYFPARVLMGFGSGALWIGITFGTLERWPGQEYLCMSRILAAYSVGALVGPALGALGGVRLPFFAYLLLVGAVLPFALAIAAPAAPRTFGSERVALRLPGFWIATAGITFAYLALGLVDGVLPLHFGSRLSQAQIGGLYVGMALVLGAAATAAGTMPPRPLLGLATLAVIGGVALAGAAGSVGLWVLALIAIAAGVGLGETAALGVLLQEVGVERLVLAMVVWSQLAIVGYLVGPLAGGGIADSLGYGALGLVPLAAAGCVAAAYGWSRRRRA